MKSNNNDREQIPCPDGIIGCAVIHYAPIPTNPSDDSMGLDDLQTTITAYEAETEITIESLKDSSHPDAKAVLKLLKQELTNQLKALMGEKVTTMEYQTPEHAKELTYVPVSVLEEAINKLSTLEADIEETKEP